MMLPALSLLVILVLSGCGGGGDSNSSVAGETTNGAGAEKGSGEAQGKDANEQGSVGNGASGANVAQTKGEEEPGITPEQEHKATTADITLESPAFKASTPLPARYTCDGENTWPTLNWKGLPSEAEELVLLVLSVDPVKQKLLFDWAVGGLDPGLTSIEEGKLPEGAVVGENSFGESAYNVCPGPGTAQNYIFMLFAIPTALDPGHGFDARTVRGEVLAEHGNVGLLNTAYQR